MKVKVINLFLLCGTVIFILNFKVTLVNGDSMLPTYHNNDLVLCNKRRLVTRGDIIVFNKNGIKIKRVLATNGDSVEMKDNNLYVNDAQITLYHSEKDENYDLNHNEFFAVGDNYLNSYDSRDFGVINSKDIICSIKSDKR